MWVGLSRLIENWTGKLFENPEGRSHGWRVSGWAYKPFLLLSLVLFVNTQCDLVYDDLLLCFRSFFMSDYESFSPKDSLYQSNETLPLWT
jgi:hypothetical protein